MPPSRPAGSVTQEVPPDANASQSQGFRNQPTSVLLTKNRNDDILWERIEKKFSDTLLRGEKFSCGTTLPDETVT